MEFTGKNKSNFIDYYQRLVLKPKSTYPKFEQLENLPLSMQFGVVQDYANSIGYDVKVYTAHGYFYKWSVRYAVQELANGTSKTRDEARKAALKAFDEIVNGDKNE